MTGRKKHRLFSWMALLLLVACFCLVTAPAQASSLSMEGSYHHYYGKHGAGFRLLYTYGINDWFEFGADGGYWSQFGEDEVDSYTRKYADDQENTIRRFKDYEQRNAGFFGPLLRFPLALNEDRKVMFVPNLGIGGEAFAVREWTEETVDREGAADSEYVGHDVDNSGFGWYVRPGITFVAAWWRLSYLHYFTQDGAVQFTVGTGVDIFRIIGVSK